MQKTKLPWSLKTLLTVPNLQFSFTNWEASRAKVTWTLSSNKCGISTVPSPVSRPSHLQPSLDESAFSEGLGVWMGAHFLHGSDSGLFEWLLRSIKESLDSQILPPSFRSPTGRHEPWINSWFWSFKESLGYVFFQSGLEVSPTEVSKSICKFKTLIIFSTHRPGVQGQGWLFWENQTGGS